MIFTITRWILEWVLQNVSQVAGVGEASSSLGNIGSVSLMYVGVDLVDLSEDEPRNLGTVVVVILRLFDDSIPERTERALQFGG